jgi:hypothetical protein
VKHPTAHSFRDSVIHKRRKLAEEATTKDFLVVQAEGKRQLKRNLKHYNLDAIIISETASANAP